MIRKLKVLVLILILLVGLFTVYLAIKHFQLNPTYSMVDSFASSSKDGDTLRMNYPLDEHEIKDALFLIRCYSSWYGGEGFTVSGIKSGESTFKRIYEIQDSSLIYNKHRIRVGESFTDTIRFNSKRNIFQRVTNRLVIKNEGFVKVASVGLDAKVIQFSKPILVITGDSHDYYNTRSKIKFIYKTLPFILIILGLIYWILDRRIKHKYLINR